jgi:hypothetical protein
MKAITPALLLLAVSSSLAACEGQVDLGPIPGSDGGGSSQDAAVDALARDDATPPSDATTPGDAGVTGEAGATEAAPPLDAQACVPALPVDGSCAATCCTPAGTVQEFANVQDEDDAIEGAWRFCTPDVSDYNMAVPSDVIGIEFEKTGPDAGGPCFAPEASDCRQGRVHYLVQGPSGPVRGAGFAYERWYAIQPGSSYQFTITDGNGRGFLDLRYSPCPTEMQIFQMSVATPALVVRF